MDILSTFFQMNAQGGQLDDLFLTVLNMSVTGALVICVVLLLRLALRRAPKQYSYWLWSAAGFRLLCPVSWRSVFSIFSLAPASSVAVETLDSAAPVSSMASIPADIGMMAQPKVTLPVPQLSEAVNRVLPAADPFSSVNPVQLMVYIGALVWLAGAAAMLIWGAVSYVRLVRRLRTAVRMSDGVWQSEAVGSPFLLGFLRPRIYLPYGLEGARLDYVLAHERFHIARRDYLVKLLAFLLLCVHWFNPLVWLAFSRMGRDMEMRCDEAVLGRTAAKRRDYSETLLSFAVGGRFPSPGPLAFGESGVKARIRNALKWRKPRTWVTVTALLLAAAGIVACTANPAQPEEPDTETQTELTGTPWDWTSTVSAAGLEGTYYNLEETYRNQAQAAPEERALYEPEVLQVCKLLLAVPPEAIYPGRGYPSLKRVTLTDGTARWTLRFGGDCVVLDFDDETAKQWPIDPENPAPSWEIHDAPLLAYLNALQTTPALQFSDALRRQIIEDWKTHQPIDATTPGSVYRYFDTWAEATAWAGWTPDNPLEDESGWLEKKNTAGTDVVLRGETDHAAVHARGDAEGNCLGLSLSAGYACVYEGVRVQFRADWGVHAVGEHDGVTWVWGDAPAASSEDEGENYLARELRYDRGGADYTIRLISLGKDREALDAAWLRLANNLYQTPPGVPSVKKGLTELVPTEPLAWAQERTMEAAERLNRLGRAASVPYRVSQATVTDLTRIDTGTAALDYDIAMYRLGWSFSLGTPKQTLLSDELREGDMGYGDFQSLGKPYLILLHDKSGWTRLGAVTDVEDDPAYTDPEILEQYGGNPYTAACMICYQNWQAEQRRAGNASQMTVTSGGVTVAPYEMLRYEKLWSDEHGGWINGDGIPLAAALEHTGEIPSLTLAEDFALTYAEGVSRRAYPKVYDTDFRLLEECSPAGAAQLFFLEPGEYYVVFPVYGPVGRYIAAEDAYEESGWDCLIRLTVERQLAQPWTPGDAPLSEGVIHLSAARLGNVTRTDSQGVWKLAVMLERAEEVAPAGCPFGSVLWLRRNNNNMLAVCPAEDGCGVFWSGGKYYRYAEDGSALWALFDPETSPAGLPGLNEGDAFRLILERAGNVMTGQVTGDAAKGIQSPWGVANAWGTYASLNAIRWTETEAQWKVTHRSYDEVGYSLPIADSAPAVQLDTEDWTLTAYAYLDAVLWVDHGLVPRWRWLLPDLGQEGDRLVYELLRSWYDEAEFAALRQEIVIPDRGQGPAEAAEDWCKAWTEQSLKVSRGSIFRNRYVKTLVTENNGPTPEGGYTEGQKWRFRLNWIFVPENERAMHNQMAGNTMDYTGDDPEVPEGAYICTRMGYVVLEPDGWHGVITGTG